MHMIQRQSQKDTTSFFYEETPSPTPYFFLFPLVSKDVMTWCLFEMANIDVLSNQYI